VASTDLSILLLTLRVAFCATVLILPLGIGAGWLLARRQGGFGLLVETLLSLPLVLPPTAVGLLLLQVLRPKGVIGRLLEGAGLELLFTWKAAVVAAAVMSFPLLVRPARTAFEEIDPRMLAMGRSLGSGPLRVFGRIALPLAWRGILAGTLLAFCRALGEFGATILVAGNIPGRTQTLSLAIFQRTQIGQDEAAMRLVALTVVIAFVTVLASELVARRRSQRTAT
jgi:molybdate transport system permease protein